MTERERDTLNATLAHIRRVGHLLTTFAHDLMRRAIEHDRSKMEEPEFSRFAEVTHKLAGTTYDSEEYHATKAELDDALIHHYAENSHHPEHYSRGVNGMTLMDINEMFADWIAANERHDDGDIYDSIEANEERFGICPQLSDIFRNTARALEEGNL